MASNYKFGRFSECFLLTFEQGYGVDHLSKRYLKDFNHWSRKLLKFGSKNWNEVG